MAALYVIKQIWDSVANYNIANSSEKTSYNVFFCEISGDSGLCNTSDS